MWFWAPAKDGIKRLNTILTDMCRDVWMYVSMERPGFLKLSFPGVRGFQGLGKFIGF